MIEGTTLFQLVAAVLSVGLIVSAFLAIQLDEAMYSVISLSVTLILLAVMYWIYNAPYAAVFQLVAGISTLVVMFLAGEMLSEQKKKRDSARHVIVTLVIALIISLPTLFLPILNTTALTPQASGVTFATDMWNLRSIDIVLQGLVILVIAIGVAVVLTQKKAEAAVPEPEPRVDDVTATGTDDEAALMNPNTEI
jgi:NADH:ubiquinone oxidoreductase subunit 6 (subunit J)